MRLAAETHPADPAQQVRDGFSVPQGELWVFGYGSLMWDPGFTHDHAAPALLRGYHRAFCIYSTRHRGTHEKPGLVLGLNRGGACRGMAYRVPAAAAASALDTLWDREMPSAVYTPRRVRVTLAGQGAQCVMALAFVANTRHERYVGDLAAEDIARLIAGGRGQRGHNAEYLINTLRHLEALGVRDAKLHKLYLHVLALQAAQG